MPSRMYKANLFILNVRDREDDFHYLTLIFDTQERLDECKQVINMFDYTWYQEEGGLNSYTGSYYEDLLAILEEKGFFEYEATIQTLYIR